MTTYLHCRTAVVELRNNQLGLFEQIKVFIKHGTYVKKWLQTVISNLCHLVFFCIHEKSILTEHYQDLNFYQDISSLDTNYCASIDFKNNFQVFLWRYFFSFTHKY